MMSRKTQHITDVRLGEPTRYVDAVGDTWDPAWAADGALYTPGNDGSGWRGACRSNLHISRLTGGVPDHLVGETFNCMPAYGSWSEKGPDGCTWKSSGCIAVDDVLYLGVARHAYGTDSGDPLRRQTACRASIIMSMDLGQTWSRSAQRNYESPMFPGHTFATPYFIHYGQDGSEPTVDNAQRYVYAISNNGFWCNGDNYILGRVPRHALERLDPSEWQYYQGGDGTDDAAWTGDSQQAAPIIDEPGHCGETGATYIRGLDRYLLVAWYYPGDPNVETDETRLVFYEAPHPWGRWRRVREIVSRPDGWYCPRILTRGQRGSDDKVQAVIVTGGDYYEMNTFYRFTTVPLEIRTGGKFPLPEAKPEPTVVNDTDTGETLFRVAYSGRWRVVRCRPKATDGTEHVSEVKHATFTVRFTGRRMKWYATKDDASGIAAVSIDGGAETMVDLYTYCAQPQHGRQVFDSGDLPVGEHQSVVRVTGWKSEQSRGTKISIDRIEVTR